MFLQEKEFKGKGGGGGSSSEYLPDTFADSVTLYFSFYYNTTFMVNTIM